MPKRCYECWLGEDDNDEQLGPTKYLVKDPASGQIRGSGWICDSHQNMLADDGYILTPIQ